VSQQRNEATNLFYEAGEYTLLLASRETAERIGNRCVRVEPSAAQDRRDWALEIAPDGRVMLAVFKAPFHDDHDCRPLGEGVTVTFRSAERVRVEEPYPGLRLYRHAVTGTIVGADLTSVCR
jgi:hypothetical protein